MSENYNDDEIIDSSEDTEKKRNKSEKFCFLCRRPESKAGPMIELPNNIHVCTDCMQKSFNSMNQQFNEGKFNYSDLLNMPNVSMIDLGSFQNPVQQPKKEKKKKKQEKPEPIRRIKVQQVSGASIFLRNTNVLDLSLMLNKLIG